MRYERALKSDFLLTSLSFHLFSIGSKPTKISKFWKIPQFFKVLKWSEMDFALSKSTQKWFFLDFILFNQVGPNNSVSEIVWNKSKSSQKQFLLTKLLQMYSMMWKACLYFFLYTCVTMYVSIKTSPYICLHVFKIVLFMYEWTIERKERMKILCKNICVFMYIIMKVFMKGYICIKLNITVLKFSNMFEWV